MSVTVVSCLYGGWYGRFARRWAEAIENLQRRPDRVVVAADDLYDIPGATVVESYCGWRYPQAYYLDRAIRLAHTEWVWIVDIDDIALPDGLAGLADVEADVWQMGFHRSDGETYVPPQLTQQQYLDSDRNVYTAGSAFRVDTYRAVGGFRDVALQDWALWRSLAAAGATFQASDRAHYEYMRHDRTRGETELTMVARVEHIAEMEAALAA